jgi:hypothetical protein
MVWLRPLPAGRRPSLLPVLLAGLLWTPSGCEREPLKLECTPLGSGDLVISELRGDQTGTDTWGQWIELYNTTTGELELLGVTLNIKKLDGSDEREIVVRDRTLHVPARGFVVLGRHSGDLPAHMDYGYEDDFASDLYVDALLQVLACEELVDQLVYRDLPSEGTWAFDGSQTLTAVSNDDEGNWCVDATEAPPQDGGTTQVGLPGTPGEVNRPCN